MSHKASICQENQSNSKAQKLLKTLIEKQQTPLNSCNKELYNLNGIIWHRDFGEKEYYLTPVIKNKKEFYKKISVYDSQMNRYKRTQLKKINVPITATSKKILQLYCINVPDYMTASVNILIPEKALAELSANNIHYKEMIPGSATQTPKSNSDAPTSIIWSEGFEGSLSPYSRGNSSGASSCYWGDVSCFSNSGGWSLWCADDGGSALSDCSDYIDNMAAFVYNIDGIYVSGYTDVQFSYWIYYDIENGYDNAYFYYYNGSSWMLLDTYTGYSGGWTQKSWLLTSFITFQWDFDFDSDNSISNYDGFYLDDMEITGNYGSQYLTVYPTDKTVAADAGYFIVDVTSNVSWTVSESSNWLYCSPTSGSNDGSFSVYYDANPNSSQRETDITVYGGGITKTVHVTQLGTSNTLSVTPETFSASENEDNFTISVVSNVSWTVSESCTWVQCSPTSGSNYGNITVNYDQNTSTSVRVCNIVIAGGGLTATVILTQAGMLPFITVNPSTINVNPSQGETTADISSNISWTVNENCDWVNCTPLSGSNFATLTIVYTANTTGSSRSCIITITGQSITETINLSQEAIALYLFVTPENITLGSSANSHDHITVSSNTDWNVTKKPTWTNLTLESGIGDGGFDIYAEQNSLPVTRTGVLTVFSQAGSKDVIISQQALGIEDLTLSNSILIYPNPTQKLIYIKSVNSTFDLMNIDINDNKGALILRYNGLHLNEQPYIINFSDMSAGVYFVKIYNDDRFCTKNIVKTE